MRNEQEETFSSDIYADTPRVYIELSSWYEIWNFRFHPPLAEKLIGTRSTCVLFASIVDDFSSLEIYIYRYFDLWILKNWNIKNDHRRIILNIIHMKDERFKNVLLNIFLHFLYHLWCIANFKISFLLCWDVI